MAFFIKALEDVAHATGIDQGVHAVTGGARLAERDGRLHAPVAFVEDVAHHHGIDKAVHKVTGGQRVMDRNGRVNKEFLSTLEKACEDSGFSMIVHVATGGNRIVRPDGTFDAEGMVKVAASVATLVADASGTAATARAAALVQKKLIEKALVLVTEVSKEGGDRLRKAVYLNISKSTLDGMMGTVNILIEGPINPTAFGKALLEFKDIPGQIHGIMQSLA